MECQKLGVPVGECCTSCHEDEEMGYSWPCLFVDEDGNDHDVCCKAAGWLEYEAGAT